MVQLRQQSLLLLIHMIMGHLALDAQAENFRPDTWYTKYSDYPKYCSIPDEMDSRSIPPLKAKSPAGETRILHVTSLIRHGARTPWASNEDCFPKFEGPPSLTEWNCKLTTIMTPPSSVENLDGNDWEALDKSFFLFEKFYDALPYLKDGISNELNGTCQLGQLILRGYEQELANGAMLREAYAYNYNNMEHDERMRLIDMSFRQFRAWDPEHLRYRADNDQRTIMSGQVLLRGLFYEEVHAYFEDTGNYPTIPLHIADRARDVMGPNPKVCPKLKDIEDRAKSSDEYQAFNNSKDSIEIRKFLNDQVGDMNEDKILDCLMTTICTDRDLPEPINDYGMEDSWFEKLAEWDIQSYNMIMKYNNSEFARLGIGPLWAEMVDIWEYFLNSDHVALEGDIVPPRLALFSGHDTTIIPLLASISPDLWGDTDWPPYASMVLIEIHEIIDDLSSNSTIYKSPFAFRLIYNGEVLTDQVPGCYPDLELCDFQILKAVIEPFAARNGDCTADEKEEEKTAVSALTKALMTTTEGIIMFIGLVLLGCVLGALAAYVLLTGKIFGRRVLPSAVLEDAAARMGLQEQDDEPDGSLEDHAIGFEDEPVGRTIY